MATIEERAKEFVMDQIVKRENGKEINVGEYKSRIKDVSKLLTEQDRIARADERERCIKAICRVCQDRIFCCNRDCMYINNIRKAIEGESPSEEK